MGERPGDLLCRLCSDAQNLLIAAPYIKEDALSRVLAAVQADASLTCITRWNPHDLAVGASDAECRSMVVDSGGAFMLHPSLHAKFYRVDDEVLIGSANLTSSAMGWSPQPNLEILCRAGEDFDSLSFQQQLLNGAREMSDDEFQQWEAIARITKDDESAISDSQLLLDIWRPATRDPVHLELSYRGREDQIASFDEREAARRDLQALLVPAGLSDEDVRMWAAACLLASPFANTVIQLNPSDDLTESYQTLARTYGLDNTEARRDMETVQNWLALLAPETLPAESQLGGEVGSEVDSHE